MDFQKNPDTNFKDLDAMDKGRARREAKALREGIEYHDFLYYVKNEPVISDAVYDKLFKRLEELEAAFPTLQSATSPTQRVGAPPEARLKKIKHAAPMLSLNAALEQRKVKNFLDFVDRHVNGDRRGYVVEPKFDGFRVSRPATLMMPADDKKRLTRDRLTNPYPNLTENAACGYSYGEFPDRIQDAPYLPGLRWRLYLVRFCKCRKLPAKEAIK